jgi:hypothetical protein
MGSNYYILIKLLIYCNKNIELLIISFEGEVVHKYDSKIYESFLSTFQKLPLAYVLQKKVMVCHGGLFKQEGIKLDDIVKTDRFRFTSSIFYLFLNLNKII